MIAQYLPVFPAATVLLTLLGVLFCDVGKFRDRQNFVYFIAVIGLVAALMQSAFLVGEVNLPWTRLLVRDGLARLSEVVVLMVGILSILGTAISDSVNSEKRAEYCFLVLSGVLGGIIVVGTQHLIISLLSIALVSVVTIFLSRSFGGDPRKLDRLGSLFVSRAFLAVLFFALSSVFLLSDYGTFEINVIRGFVFEKKGFVDAGRAAAGYLFLIFSIGIWMGVFPLGFWVAELVNIAPPLISTTVRSLLGVPASALLIRCSYQIFSVPVTGALEGWLPASGFNWNIIIAAVVIPTVVLAATLGLARATSRWILSSLVFTNVGFILSAILAADREAMVSVFYFLFAEVLAGFGLFFLLALLPGSSRRDDEQPVLWRTFSQSPWEGVSFLLFLAAFLGLPPWPGFLAKFSIFASLLRSGHVFVFVAMAIATACNMVAVAKVVFAQIGNKGREEFSAEKLLGRPKLRMGFVGLVILPLFAMAAFPGRLIAWIEQQLASFLT